MHKSFYYWHLCNRVVRSHIQTLLSYTDMVTAAALGCTGEKGSHRVPRWELQCCHSPVVAKDACGWGERSCSPMTNIHSMFTDPLISNMMPSHTQKADTLWNYLVISYTGRFLQC